MIPFQNRWLGFGTGVVDECPKNALQRMPDLRKHWGPGGMETAIMQDLVTVKI